MSVERARYNPELTEQEQAAKIEYEEIKELEGPSLEILKQLKEKIISGDFGTIIGDDASGRIPALIMGKFLNSYNVKHGLGKVETLFVAGSGSHGKRNIQFSNREEQIKQYLLKTKLNRGMWVLVVTDIIATGNTLKPLTFALRKLGIKYDVATISDRSYHKDNIKENLGVVPIAGDSFVPSIYDQKTLSGVSKSYTDIVSHRVKTTRKTEGARDIQGIINQARVDANQVAENLLEKFEELE